MGAKENRDIPDAPCTTAFCNLMREVAQSGHLGEMLAVIVVCEWSYLSWGERVLSKTKRDNFETYEWVDLHSIGNAVYGKWYCGITNNPSVRKAKHKYNLGVNPYFFNV